MNPEFIDVLIQAKPKEIGRLYHSNRTAFIVFGKKYGVSEDTMADIYQEAFIVIRKQAIQGKLKAIHCSFKTYLFGIGKKMIFNHQKSEKNTTALLPELHISDTIEEINFDIIEELSEEQKKLRDFFDKLGKRCQDMLILFFYRGLTIEEIAQKEGYENTNVVSSQKSRCIKQLKEMINTPKL